MVIYYGSPLQLRHQHLRTTKFSLNKTTPTLFLRQIITRPTFICMWYVVGIFRNLMLMLCLRNTVSWMKKKPCEKNSRYKINFYNNGEKVIVFKKFSRSSIDAEKMFFQTLYKYQIQMAFCRQSMPQMLCLRALGPK